MEVNEIDVVALPPVSAITERGMLLWPPSAPGFREVAPSETNRALLLRYVRSKAEFGSPMPETVASTLSHCCSAVVQYPGAGRGWLHWP